MPRFVGCGGLGGDQRENERTEATSGSRGASATDRGGSVMERETGKRGREEAVSGVYRGRPVRKQWNGCSNYDYQLRLYIFFIDSTTLTSKSNFVYFQRLISACFVKPCLQNEHRFVTLRSRYIKQIRLISSDGLQRRHDLL